MLLRHSQQFLFSFFALVVVVSPAFTVDYFITWTTGATTCKKQVTRTTTGISSKANVCLPNAQTEDVQNTANSVDTNNREIVYELLNTTGGSLLRRTVFEPGKPATITNTSVQFAQTNVLQGLTLVIPNRLLAVGLNRVPALRNDYLVYGLGVTGLPTEGKRTSIFSNNPNSVSALGASAAPDGGMAVQLTMNGSVWTLSTRKLRNGLPVAPTISWAVPAFSGYSPDITNAIEANTGAAGVTAQKVRYIVYRAFNNFGQPSQQSQILIQTIDDATGQREGPARPLTVFLKAARSTAEAQQSLAIAPDGGLLVYTQYGACGKQFLKALRLQNGSLIPGSTVLAGCTGMATSPAGVIGVDITLMPEPASNSNPTADPSDTVENSCDHCLDDSIAPDPYSLCVSNVKDPEGDRIMYEVTVDADSLAQGRVTFQSPTKDFVSNNEVRVEYSVDTSRPGPVLFTIKLDDGKGGITTRTLCQQVVSDQSSCDLQGLCGDATPESDSCQTFDIVCD